MSFIPSFNKNPIGLDIGSRVIKAVQFGRERGQHVVTAWADITRLRPGTDIDQDEVQRLSRVLSQLGFSGRQLIISAPSEHVMASVIDMPPRDSGAPYDAIASQEFARLQNLEPGGFEVSWWDIPKPARTSSTKVMAVGCAHADTDPLLDVLTECGFDVIAMDSGLCSLVRACREQLGPPERISAVLDLGWDAARLGLVHEGVVVFERTFSGSGMGGLHAQVCENLNIEPAEADCLIQEVGLIGFQEEKADGDERTLAVAPMLAPIFATYFKDIARDLEASFEYAVHQYPDAQPHRLVLVGGGGAIPGLASYMNTLTELEVVSADATGWGVSSGVSAKKTAHPLLAAAKGLAGYYDQDSCS